MFKTDLTFDIEFRIKRVIHRRNDGKYRIKAETVKQVGYKPKKEFPAEFTGMGFFPVLNVGSVFSCKGHFFEDTNYGYLVMLEGPKTMIIPDTEQELISAINRNVSGVGKETARKLYQTLGASLIPKICENPEILNEVPGLKPKQIAAIRDWCSHNYIFDRLLQVFRERRIPAFYAEGVYKAFGIESVNKILKDPYIMYFIGNGDSVPFKIIDRMAYDLYGKNSLWYWQSMPRMVCAISAAMDQYMENDGGTCLPWNKMAAYTADFLKHTVFSLMNDKQGGVVDMTFPPELFQSNIEVLERHDKVHVTECDGEKIIYQTDVWKKESESAWMVRKMILKTPNPLVDPELAQKFLSDRNLSEGQMNAVEMVLRNQFCIITGGPGTGKTYVLKSILDVIRKFSPKTTFALMSPTAKAASRMREVTGEDASTMHSIMHLRPGYDGDVTALIDADIVFVDEASMIDTDLFWQLLRHVSEKTRIVLIGDFGQLPSVNYGDVLHQLLISPLIPQVILDHIFRQQGSDTFGIVENAARIRSHDKSKIRKIGANEEKGFAFIDLTGKQPSSKKRRKNPETEAPATEEKTVAMEKKVADTIVQKVKELLSSGISLDDIMVLTPVHETGCGTISLNNYLQDAINPVSKSAIAFRKQFRNYEVEFHVGDRVIHTKNDKKLGVKNGDIGYVKDVYEWNDMVYMKVEYPGLEDLVTYSPKNCEEVSLAYAITVHKSQGSEASYVLMPFVNSATHVQMLTNKLIYTALTRAKKEFIGVGDLDQMKAGCLNLRENQRFSLLSEMISGKVQEVLDKENAG